MLSILLAIALPVGPLLLARRERPISWQIAAYAAVHLIFAGLSETWFRLAPDSYSWNFLGLAPTPKSPTELQSGVAYVGSASFGLLLLAGRFALLALLAWVQERWRRLFLPNAVTTLFWVIVVSDLLSSMLSVPVELHYAKSGELGGTLLLDWLTWFSHLAVTSLNGAYFAFASVLLLGLFMFFPGILRWIRHAL